MARAEVPVREVLDLARKAGVEMPIVDEVHRILYEDGGGDSNCQS